jgi:hypothetical protein
MQQTTISEYGENSAEVDALNKAFAATEIVPDK